MRLRNRLALALFSSLLALGSVLARAGSADLLPVRVFESAHELAAPVANVAFVPGEDALPAPEFAGVLKIQAERIDRTYILATDGAAVDYRDCRTFGNEK